MGIKVDPILEKELNDVEAMLRKTGMSKIEVDDDEIRGNEVSDDEEKKGDLKVDDQDEENKDEESQEKSQDDP